MARLIQRGQQVEVKMMLTLSRSLLQQVSLAFVPLASLERLERERCLDSAPNPEVRCQLEELYELDDSAAARGEELVFVVGPGPTFTPIALHGS